MEKNVTCKGIDIFRLIASLLVIAIHTSPLLDINSSADFILTRAVARIAVPFFFITSGFFVFKKCLSYNNSLNNYSPTLSFIKKTAIIYLISIVLYLPLNIYNHTYLSWQNPLNLLKDLLFNGTFYHLWYLPASIIGITICSFFIKIFNEKTAFIVCVVLYIIGLFGDSYYGFIENTPLNKAYVFLFNISDYTRNGVFMAPIFFFISYLFAKNTIYIKHKKSNVFLCLLMFAMIIEAVLLNFYKIQKHDSMYLLLPFCMFFLFQSLLYYHGYLNKIPRNMSLIVYIIHPAIIVFIRMIGKFMHADKYLIENNFIHFITVSITSFAVAFLISNLLKYIKKNQS